MAKRKKPEESGGGGSPAWMATFSDLMNLLLCFFILLFSMSTVDAAKFEEIKPSSELWAYIFDLDAIKYNRYTKGMLKEPFYNPEFDEVTHWIHYYSMKAISPFYNKILITGAPTE